MRRGLSSALAAAAEPFLFAASPDEPEVWLGEADISSLLFYLSAERFRSEVRRIGGGLMGDAMSTCELGYQCA